MAVINSYETIFVFTMKNGEDFYNSLSEKFKKLIADNGTVESVDEWGKRRLAYPINYETEGFYILVNFQSVPGFIAELDRVVKITDGVLRHITVKKEIKKEK